MYINTPRSTSHVGNPVLVAPRLASRSSSDSDSYCYGFSCGNEWVWARWVLVVFFLFALATLGLAAIRINGRRMKLGQRPIIGTAWFTPPSYRQSERQYRSSTQDYVPPYTATANENDLGYYDNEGNFHLSSKTDNTTPPPPIDTADVADYPQEPPSAVTRDDNDQERYSADFSEAFHRYYQGTTVGQTTDDTGHDTERPSGRAEASASADGTSSTSSPIELQEIAKKPATVQVAHV
ncbi:LAFA_0C07514g1_1 [Lachancea sp. 'fantastica']|nr:LAFA_0C07514g1_1 [Lachancea sp. 'fantastica']